jgi:adenylosuccinate synthase
MDFDVAVIPRMLGASLDFIPEIWLGFYPYVISSTPMTARVLQSECF